MAKVFRKSVLFLIVTTIAIALIAGQFSFIFADDTTPENPTILNGWTEDYTQYYIDGVMATEWQTIDSHKYYFDKTTGIRYLGLQKIDGNYYYFSKTSDPKGALVTGWKTISSSRHYFDKKTGAMFTGYKKIGSNHYYFSKSSGTRGAMVTDKWITYKGVKHWIKKNGTEIKATKYIAFTFDDGPSVNTPYVLKVLKRYGCSATFFQVGNRIYTYRSVEKKIIAEGSEIGNHSWNHANFANLSSAAIRVQVGKTNNRIRKYSGKPAKLMRLPYGSASSTVQAAVGMPMIMWNVDTMDWSHRNTAKTVAAIMKNPRNGNIVLMHDLYPTSYHASAIAIPELIQRGYKIVSVSKLAKLQGEKLKKGMIYYSVQ